MADPRSRHGGRGGNQETSAPKKGKRASAATVEIIDRLFSEPVEIVENGVGRKGDFSAPVSQRNPNAPPGDEG
jgi:hypothetical protein